MATLEVLKGVDLDVPVGSVACIIGPSGSGKSTFLRCINHLEKLSGGILLVDSEFVGYDLRDNKLYEVKDELRCQRRTEIGMLFQSFNLFSHMTVMENMIEAPTQVRRVPHRPGEGGGGNSAGPRRPLRQGGSLSARAFGRTAAACRDRARHGDEAEGAAVR